MNATERRIMAELAATRPRHFTRKATGGKFHVETCSRGLWQHGRERYVDTGDGAGWGAPCSQHCRADSAAFDAAEALLAESAPLQLVQSPLLPALDRPDDGSRRAG